MSAQIDMEDSAQHLILADFYERTEGEFVLVSDALVDNLGYRCRVMTHDFGGCLAEAGSKNPLEAERMAVSRGLKAYNEVMEELKAAAEALGFTEED